MSMSTLAALPPKAVSLKFVTYTIPCSDHLEIYLDRQAAIEMARAIRKLDPRPLVVAAAYCTYETSIMEDPSRFQGEEQALLDSIYIIIEPVLREQGLQLYRVNFQTAMLYLGLDPPCLEWDVVYQPAEQYDEIKKEIQEYVESFAQPVISLLESSLDQVPLLPTFPYSSQSGFMTRSDSGIESGYATPAEEMEETQPIENQSLNAQLEALLRELDQERDANVASEVITDTMKRKAKGSFPISQFTIADLQRDEDSEAALTILNIVKILAIDPNLDSQHRWSISHENQAIKSMSIDTSLNIGRENRTPVEKIRRLKNRYDKTDEQDNESFSQILLMVLIRLYRQELIYQVGKKGPGSYACDFDKMCPKSKRYTRHSMLLCRIIVSCAHPCILVFLLRLAIRSGLTIGALLDALPIPQFCLWIATGRVSDSNSSSNPRNSAEVQQRHKDLFWLHGHILLPLLFVASHRVNRELSLLDGTIICNEDTCLRAIVHSTKQVKYNHFVLGHSTDEEWARGKVLLETKLIHNQSVSEFSIETEKRTFNKFRVASYSHIEHFEDVPRSLKNHTLDMTVD